MQYFQKTLGKNWHQVPLSPHTLLWVTIHLNGLPTTLQHMAAAVTWQDRDALCIIPYDTTSAVWDFSVVWLRGTCCQFFQECFLEVLHEAVYFVVFLTIDACRLHHRRILDSIKCVMSLVPRVGRQNKMWQLLKVLLGLTGDLFVSFVQ